MRFDSDQQSSDVEDRRGGGMGGGGGGGFRRGGIGLGGLVVLGVLSLIFKRNLITPFTNGGNAPARQDYGAGQGGGARGAAVRPADENKVANFAGSVLDDAQATWATVLARENVRYRKTKMVLFTDETTSGCGSAESATGPFYCPADEKVYVDLAFFRELATRFKAPGDFAQAYVIAHEIGHHVQTVLGIEAKMRNAQRQRPQDKNALSVKMELQADCFAGVWAHSTQTRGLLDPGDIDEGLAAAAAVGDDRLQKQATGRVRPESWTHGSSAQRATWFRKGFATGSISDCNTFGTP
jgi:uncharacterized protein